MPGEDDDDPADTQCPIRAAIGHLCQELNLDAGSAAEALRDFRALRSTYSLESVRMVPMDWSAEEHATASLAYVTE